MNKPHPRCPSIIRRPHIGLRSREPRAGLSGGRSSTPYNERTASETPTAKCRGFDRAVQVEGAMAALPDLTLG